MNRLALLLSLGLAACGAGPDEVRPFFADEVVEASARQLRIVVARDTTCDALQAVPFDAIPTEGLLLDRTVDYPPRSDSDPLRGVPRGQALILTAAAQDEDGWLVGRGCRPIRLQGEASVIELNLSLSLDCPQVPEEVDVGIVVDLSDAMRLANIAVGERLGPELAQDFVRDGDPARWAVVLAGEDRVRSVGPTADSERVRAQLTEPEFGGASRLYDGILQASRQLRDQLSCRSRMALVVVTAGPDESSEGRIEEVFLALDGAEQDRTDDIPVVGLGLSVDGVETLQGILLPPSVVIGATNADTYGFAVSQARLTVFAEP